MNNVKITLVAAMGNNREIGLNNKLLWRLAEDLKHFKKITMGHTLVMGRKTLESLPGVLPGRPHWVLSRHPKSDTDQISWFGSTEELINCAKSQGRKELFVAGGADIYRQFLPLAQEMILTHVDGFFSADAYFPAFKAAEWHAEEVMHHSADDKNHYRFKVMHYKKASSFK